ncbi:LicD family protein [Salinicola halophyticus]|uniref:LicD family protein n=1 Tax=Salinicola halophyticus TaxID=1808881 RepID=UPI003F4746A4
MIGLVESMTESEATGWIQLPSGSEFAHIELYFNDQLLLKFRTTHEVFRFGVKEKIAFFSLRFKSIWRYMAPEDKLSFKFDGERLFVAGHGYSYCHGKERITHSRVLFKKLNEGYIFNQKGYLRLSKTLDYEWQNSVLALYHRVRDFLSERHGLQLFVMSGTLLGTVRQGEFIGHDHDFDVGLISKSSSGEGAKSESKEFSKDLMNNGFVLQFKPSCTYIGHPDYPGAQIDLVRMYFDESSLLKSAFGFATDKQLSSDVYQGVTKATISGHEVEVPHPAESFLEVIYGEDWRTPNPTFNWSRELKVRDKSSRLSSSEIADLNNYARKLV